MAEVLGIITSGMEIRQLGGSVDSSIIKLKEYSDQVKDAPGEIRQLLLEIDSLNLILSHIERIGTERDSRIYPGIFVSDRV